MVNYQTSRRTKKEYMKKVSLSSLNLFSFLNGSVMTSSIHPNLFHTVFNAGISVAVVNSDVGTPFSRGIIIHTQRLSKGDTGPSATMYQLFLGENGVFERRRVELSNSTVVYSPWEFSG